MKNAMTPLERLKGDLRLLAALSGEGIARFGSELGFAGIDGETRDGAWFHSRPFYSRNSHPPGYRIMPLELVELKSLQQARAGYFVAVLIRNGSTDPIKNIDPSLLEHLSWLAVEIADDGESLAIVDARHVRHPVALRGAIEQPDGVPLRVHKATYACTMPAELVVQTSSDRCHFVLGCNVPRLQSADYEFELTSKKGGAIDKTVLLLDVDPLPGSNDRLVVQAADRYIGLRQLAWTHRQPSPALVLHVVFDRTMIGGEFWGDAAQVTSAEPTGNPTLTPPTDWNSRLRRRTAEAVAAALSGTEGLVELELWPFADLPIHDAGRESVLTLGATSRAWNQVVCPDMKTFVEAMNSADECGWRYGLDYVDAVDEVLAEVALSVEKRNGVQHAVLIVGDSPPPPERVGDTLWEAIVEERQNNCRRSPLFMQTMARLLKSNVPVLWAFVRTKLMETQRDELVQDPRPIQARVAKALGGIEGLTVSECDPDTLIQTVSRLVRSHALRDIRFHPPTVVSVRRGLRLP